LLFAHRAGGVLDVEENFGSLDALKGVLDKLNPHRK
jgi:hypothetical protein